MTVTEGILGRLKDGLGSGLLKGCGFNPESEAVELLSSQSCFTTMSLSTTLNLWGLSLHLVYCNLQKRVCSSARNSNIADGLIHGLMEIYATEQVFNMCNMVQMLSRLLPLIS